MRIRFPFALTLALLFMRSALGQGISIHLENASLEKAFDLIRDRGHVEITFRHEDLDFLVSLDLHHVSVDSAMSACLRDLPLSYSWNHLDQDRSLSVFRVGGDSLVGRVFSDSGEPQEKLSVSVRGSDVHVVTGFGGRFVLWHVPLDAVLLVNGVNIVPRSFRPMGRIRASIIVDKKTSVLMPALIAASFENGIQAVPVKYSPAAFAISGHDVWDRIPLTGVFDRLTGLVSGLQSGPGTGNALNVSIRGRSTIFGLNSPMFVWDRFPFYGDVNDINPNDIDTITVLKDAVAAASWGARSVNGVIVISSKHGSKRKTPLWSFDASWGFTPRPDLHYIPQIKSSDYVMVEKALFDAGVYDAALSDPGFPALSPAVEVFDKVRRGLMSSADGAAAVHSMGLHDSRSDLSRYFYQPAMSQQLYISVSGGGLNKQSYQSLGYSRNSGSLWRNGYERATYHDAHMYRLLRGRLEINTSGNLVYSITRNNNPGSLPVAYPYAALVDASGNPLPVDLIHRAGYLDSAGGGRLLDWKTRPLQDLRLADNTSRQLNAYFQSVFRYSFRRSLSAEFIWRVIHGETWTRDLYDAQSSYTRNIVNEFTQLSSSDAVYPVPPGNILSASRAFYTDQDLRAQLFYRDSLGHGAFGIRYDGSLGLDLSDLRSGGLSRRVYGYDPGRDAGIPVDLVGYYADYTSGNKLQIPGASDVPRLYNRFVSVYGSLDLVFGDRLSLHMSGRKDATNIVGVDANRRWSPFWAAGLGYWIGSPIKLRAGFGCNGNIGSRNASLVTQTLGNNAYGYPQSGIVNPPNPRLTWERTAQLNIGADFAFFSDALSPSGRVRGSFDVFHKYGSRLLGSDSLPPSAGLAAFFGNTASMQGQGLDLVLSADLIRSHDFSWNAMLLFSYAHDWITRYSFMPPTVAGYVSGGNPMMGHPVTSLFSYRWAGLDGVGDPLGVFRGAVSKDYHSIMGAAVGGPPGGDATARNVAGASGIVYSGSYLAPVFGSLQNSFHYKRWTLSVLLVFKLCFVFRRPSINYDGLFNSRETGHKDFSFRWIRPGDEHNTYVPAMSVVNDPDRSSFYEYASVLITRGDHVRCRDLNLSYEVRKGMVVYGYVGNLGIVWKANRNGIDPDAYNYGDLPPARMFAIGIRGNF